MNSKKSQIHNWTIVFTCVVALALWGCEKEETEPSAQVVSSISDRTVKLTDSLHQKYGISVAIKSEIAGSQKNIVNAGICWSATGSPSLNDSVRYLDTAMIHKLSAKVTSNFTLSILVLTEDLEYRLSGFVVTALGETLYSKSIIIPSYAIDIDKNIYKTILIGTQRWMAQDLRCKHFRSGAVIDDLMTKEADKNAHDNEFGACLYNWKTVTDSRQLAPEGWHIATEEEWQQLEAQLGLQQSQLTQIGWRGTNQSNLLRDTAGIWKQPDDIYAAWPTNETGFSARPTRTYLPGGKGFGDEKAEEQVDKQTVGFWWTATSFSDSQAWYRYLDFNNSKVFRAHENTAFGFAVRCIKNQ